MATVAATTRSGYRREPPSEPTASVTCAECGGSYEISTRNARRHRTEGVVPRCSICRGLGRLPEPSEADRQFWLDALGIEEARSLAGMIWPDG